MSEQERIRQMRQALKRIKAGTDPDEAQAIAERAIEIDDGLKRSPFEGLPEWGADHGVATYEEGT